MAVLTAASAAIHTWPRLRCLGAPMCSIT